MKTTNFVMSLLMTATVATLLLGIASARFVPVTDLFDVNYEDLKYTVTETAQSCTGGAGGSGGNGVGGSGSVGMNVGLLSSNYGNGGNGQGGNGGNGGDCVSSA